MFDLQGAIDQAQFVTFLTGAGVSTASGIPDYRSKGGLYSDMVSPEYALSADNLRDHPDDFYQWVKAHMYYPEARPNIIHEKMAAITNAKGAIVTQNVDGLHTQAGAKNVVEFHGNLYRLHCQTCGQAIDYQTYLASEFHTADGGVIRPDIVLYGEQIAPRVIDAALEAVNAADLIVVVGTSFQVYPFAGLIQGVDPMTTLVAVNREAIDLPYGAHMVVGDAVKVFEDLQVTPA
ncbi:NAD-dependent protein deacylase [Lacticaseibacillus mingshuiensis]|uniref:protein acetyllysine N-acetyltransferase n=1 Tax=Lacticaseibacillus mingshuiensis TaxID=2799574 RepID=A0ABW4CK87_9LACO|nr:NAD-dependent protein deacylase [Lacticaseibacillus mingshuiensis]